MFIFSKNFIVVTTYMSDDTGRCMGVYKGLSLGISNGKHLGVSIGHSNRDCGDGNGSNDGCGYGDSSGFCDV